MEVQPYRARRPRASPLWRCLSGHFDSFLEGYEERYRPSYGHLRPVIPEVVGKFMGCGDYSRGFARVRCDLGYEPGNLGKPETRTPWDKDH